MQRFTIVAVVLAFGAMTVGAAFSQPGQAALKTEKIAENIYLVRGGVANTGFVVGEKEAAAIDAQMTAESARAMIDEIRKTAGKPVTKLILTHSDGDHVNGLAGFPQGIEIISSVQAKNEMAEAFKAPNSQNLQAHLPTKTFADRLIVDVPPERIELIHFGPAHTSGDAVVLFPARRLAFVGDLVFIGMDPLIHRSKGGNSAGLIKTLKALLELNADRYVPGHGEIVNKDAIGALLKGLEEKREKIEALVKEGRSLADAKKALGVPDSPAKPGGFSFPSIVEVMYLELSGK